jgi:hypothetical protein
MPVRHSPIIIGIRSLRVRMTCLRVSSLLLTLTVGCKMSPMDEMDPNWPGGYPPSQYVMPPRESMAQPGNGGLQLKGNLGRTVVLAPDPTSATNAGSLALVPFAAGTPSVATVVNVNVVDPANPDVEASAVISGTLLNPPFRQVGPNQLQPFLTANPGGMLVAARPSALIQWGSGGSVAEAVVDYENGFSFSVPASWLRITAQNDPIPNAIAAVGPNQVGRGVQVGAFVGLGGLSKSNTFNAKRTIFEDNFAYVAGGQQNSYEIPQFATNLLVYYIGADATDPLQVFILNEAGINILAATFPKNGQQDIPIELPSDARYVDIRPASGAAFNHSVVRIIFGLAI